MRIARQLIATMAYPTVGGEFQSPACVKASNRDLLIQFFVVDQSYGSETRKWTTLFAFTFLQTPDLHPDSSNIISKNHALHALSAVG